MFHRQLYLNYTIRIVLLALFIALLVIAIEKKLDYLTIGNLVFFTVLQIFLLIRKFNKVNQELIYFFETIKNEDSNLVFKRKHGDKLLEKLYGKFDDVNRMIQEIKIEHVSQYHFLQTIIEHVNIGLILFDESGHVDLINTAAKDLLSVSSLSNINDIPEENNQLQSILLKLEPGKTKSIKLSAGQSHLNLSLRVTLLRIKGEQKKLVSIQNIKSELEQHEMETWQKLIRILTHEIMNSTAPISSSIKVIMQLLQEASSGENRSIEDLSQETIDHVVRGLSIIEERSDGLNEFVNNYRSLTQKVKPYFSLFPVSELITGLEFLIKDQLESENVVFEFLPLKDDFDLYADKKLIEQVLLNLIKNAREVIQNQDNKKILLYTSVNNKKKSIHIVDNGPGIAKEIQDQVFIPFYSTKEKGTGIGLSLSREIVKQNGGDLYFKTEPGRTEFVVTF